MEFLGIYFISVQICPTVHFVDIELGKYGQIQTENAVCIKMTNCSQNAEKAHITHTAKAK